MAGHSIHTTKTFGSGSASTAADFDVDELLRLSSNLSSLVAGIQALAREREHEVTFAHIVNLADITSGHLDLLHNAIDRMQWAGQGLAEDVDDVEDPQDG